MKKKFFLSLIVENQEQTFENFQKKVANCFYLVILCSSIFLISQDSVAGKHALGTRKLCRGIFTCYESDWAWRLIYVKFENGESNRSKNKVNKIQLNKSQKERKKETVFHTLLKRDQCDEVKT